MKDNYDKFVAEYGNKPLQAIIESVRHNKYMMMMDVLILPHFIYTSFALSGLNVSNTDQFWAAILHEKCTMIFEIAIYYRNTWVHSCR